MKILVIFICTALAVINGLSVEEQWLEFKAKFGQQYRSRLEETKRYQIFKENVRKIEEHNKNYETGLLSYKLGVNKFAHLTEEEFVAGLNPPKKVERQAHIISHDFKYSDIPDDVDWRDKGAVTRVKDQANCGGCWAFSTTGALEGQYFLKSGELIEISEQYLIDCAIGYSNGCKGGWVENGYQFIREYGIVTEESYPYEGQDGTCKANGTLFKDIGFVEIQQNEDYMKAAVATIGPIAVTIDASYLQFYAGGVFDNDNCSSTFTNHAVLVVGYGTTELGVDYWTVKNSWGAEWGEEGYLKMSRNKNGQCAISSGSSYPVL